jgi:signal transduction histidine kinase
MNTPGVRAFLALNAVALAVATSAFLLAAGLPLAARGRLSPGALIALSVTAGVLLAVAGSLLLARVVARPVNRILETAARLDPSRAPHRLPLLGEAGGLALSRAALAFERIAAALDDEQRRLASKVEELTTANAQLAEARESLIRTEKLATVGRLGAGLAHEVGNPLGAITGYVELARRRLPPEPHPELLDALERIDSAASRIDRTVRDLLDFARPSVEQLVPVDVGTVLDAALRLASVQSRFKEVQVEVDFAPGLSRVIADEHHLGQVLLNLLLNAGDAMGGRGRVRFSARHTNAECVVIELADEGPGIAPEDLTRIFDPFFTTKEPGQGTGLGLAICHRLMESFGGAIFAGGRGPLGGAVFALHFRATAAAPLPSIPVRPPAS